MTNELSTSELEAIEAIKKGRYWNRKFYTYSNVKNGKTVIYVSNVQYKITNKDAFKAALKTGDSTTVNNSTNVNTTVNSGVGFMMKNTKANWYKVNKFGFDAIEMVD